MLENKISCYNLMAYDVCIIVNVINTIVLDVVSRSNLLRETPPLTSDRSDPVEPKDERKKEEEVVFPHR